MLNLKELEQKLDKALSNENEKELTQWLLNKRHAGLEFLGKGNLKELSVSSSILTPYKIDSGNQFLQTKDSEIEVNTQYSIAS